jgi:hypothetical protein
MTHCRGPIAFTVPTPVPLQAQSLSPLPEDAILARVLAGHPGTFGYESPTEHRSGGCYLLIR